MRAMPVDDMLRCQLVICFDAIAIVICFDALQLQMEEELASVVAEWEADVKRFGERVDR